MLPKIFVGLVFCGSVGLIHAQNEPQGILIAQCIEFAACWTSSLPTPWSYTLTATNLAGLGLGSTVSLIAGQTSQYVIRLGPTRITFNTPSGQVVQTLPEFNGGLHSDPCIFCEVDTVGTFSIPASATSGTISGTFGNSQVPNSAGVNLYLPSGCSTNVTRLSQGNPQWGTKLYDHSDFLTIQEKGCALTSLSMALNFAGIANNPGALNQLMAASDNDYFGLSVNWGPATRDASGGTLKFNSTRINSIANLTSAKQYLDDTICRDGNPVIVGVNLDSSGNPGHFVIVTGKQGDDYQIADPGYSRTKLSEYNNQFETRGFVADPPGDISELDLIVGDVGEVIVIDPSGRRTGFDPITKQILEEIPNSVYFRDGLRNDITGALPSEVSHYVQIFQPLPGTYQVIVTGLKLGTYLISGRMFSRDGGSEPEILVNAVAGLGSASAFSITVSLEPNTRPTVVALATFESTLTDISNSLKLGLINNNGIANSLSQKLQAAQRSVQPARTNLLTAFIKEVNAQAGNLISQTAVEILLQDANSLLNQ